MVAKVARASSFWLTWALVLKSDMVAHTVEKTSGLLACTVHALACSGNMSEHSSHERRILSAGMAVPPSRIASPMPSSGRTHGSSLLMPTIFQFEF